MLTRAIIATIMTNLISLSADAGCADSLNASTTASELMSCIRENELEVKNLSESITNKKLKFIHDQFEHEVNQNSLHCLSEYFSILSQKGLKASDVAASVEDFEWVDITPNRAILPVNSDVLEFTDLPSFPFFMIEIGDRFIVDYDKTKSNNWTAKAWSLDRMLINFNNKWAAFHGGRFDYHYRHTAHFNAMHGVDVLMLSKNDIAPTKIASSGTCLHGTGHAWECFEEFIIRSPAASYLHSISDIESVSGHSIDSNIVLYDMKVDGMKEKKLSGSCKF